MLSWHERILLLSVCVSGKCIFQDNYFSCVALYIDELFKVKSIEENVIAVAEIH
jgi:hypothetical protein